MKLTKELVTIVRGALCERYVNVFSPELPNYIDEIWDILQKTYSKIEGGFATASSKEELMRKVFLAKLVRRGNRIVAVKLYKDRHGRKRIAGGSDGTSQGKLDFYKLIEEDLKLRRAGVEASGPLEHVLLKLGAVPIPNSYVEKLTGHVPISLNSDGFHHTRLIQGHPHEKIILAYAGFEGQIK